MSSLIFTLYIVKKSKFKPLIKLYLNIPICIVTEEHDLIGVMKDGKAKDFHPNFPSNTHPSSHLNTPLSNLITLLFLYYRPFC